jgi:hypothetical protein
LYILGWNYKKWKYILPFNNPANDNDLTKQKAPESEVRTQESAGGKDSSSPVRGIRSLYRRFRNFFKQLLHDKFPKLFFAGVFAAVVICAIGIPSLYSIKPRNEFPKCLTQFKDGNRFKAGENFCHCIHTNGEPLNKCLNDYNNAPDDTVRTP